MIFGGRGFGAGGSLAGGPGQEGPGVRVSRAGLFGAGGPGQGGSGEFLDIGLGVLDGQRVTNFLEGDMGLDILDGQRVNNFAVRVEFHRQFGAEALGKQKVAQQLINKLIFPEFNLLINC